MLVIQTLRYSESVTEDVLLPGSLHCRILVGCAQSLGWCGVTKSETMLRTFVLLSLTCSLGVSAPQPWTRERHSPGPAQGTLLPESATFLLPVLRALSPLWERVVSVTSTV